MIHRWTKGDNRTKRRRCQGKYDNISVSYVESLDVLCRVSSRNIEIRVHCKDMHKRVSSGELYTSSGDTNARTIIAPIIDRSMPMANASSTACCPVSKKTAKCSHRIFSGLVG